VIYFRERLAFVTLILWIPSNPEKLGESQDAHTIIKRKISDFFTSGRENGVLKRGKQGEDYNSAY